MPSISSQQRIAIAIGVPVVAILLYFWLRRRQSADETGDYDREEESELVASANERTIEVKIPQSVAGVIIGKSGANIKNLEKESGARVTVKDVAEENESSERIVLIQGERERAKRAEMLVKKTLAEQPVVRTDEVFVPQRACGRIIGKGGQNIRQMISMSGAKIKIDRDGVDMSSPLRRCCITGTSEQIAIARGLLHEKVAEDKEMRTRKEFSSTFRGGHSSRKMNAMPASVSMGVMQFPKSEEFCEVFLSAIDNAGHFWVQLVTTDAPSFDKLTEELTSLYAASESQAILNVFKVGDICCAPFEYDSSWYRARVLEIHKDEMVDLFYLDFGDTGKIPKERLRELKKEHCKLPFQAIECFLANVKPKDESWTEESTEEFERLTHCAQWVPLMARALKYCGQIPCLELIDTTGQSDVNINEEMIKGQYAVYDASFPIQQPSPESQDDVKVSAEELPVTSAENAQQAVNRPAPNGNEDTLQTNRNTNVLCEPPAGNFQDASDSGVSGEDTVDSTNRLQGPMPSWNDSPVKAAVVKRISQDYSSASESSLPGVLSDDAQRAVLGVAQEQELEAVSESVVESQQDALTVEPVESGSLALAKEPVTAQDKVGYRSTLNIIPSSKRTIAATFSGNRLVPDSEGNSVKTVSSTVHRQVVSSKQSFVSSVTLPAHKADELSVSISSGVTQLEGDSPFASESAAFGASSESSTVTCHAVASEIHRAVTQTNGSEANALIYSSRLEQQSQLDEKPRLTYEIYLRSLEGTPGMESYLIKKMSDPSLVRAPDTAFDVTKATSGDDERGERLSWSAKTRGEVLNSATLKTVASEEETGVLRVSEHVERSTPSGFSLEAGSSSSLSPSGSLMDISSNTVIAEEEEYEEEDEEEEEEEEEAEKDDADGKNDKLDSESPEPDSDTESFMSAREEITSDTDTSAYVTARPSGSSTPLDTDVPVADSATEEATTPVNSDTEKEEDDEEEEDESLRGPGTPRPSPAATDESPAEPKLLNDLKSLQEQTTLLGGTVASDGDLGYRGDSEEGLASAEDLRETGRY